MSDDQTQREGATAQDPAPGDESVPKAGDAQSSPAHALPPDERSAGERIAVENGALGASPSAPAEDDLAPSRPADAAPLPAGEGTQEMEAPLGEGMGAPNNGGWAPTLRQLLAAARLDLAAAIGPEAEWPFFARGLNSSMRQALGLITIIMLVAGLPTLISLWISLAEQHSTLQLEQARGVAARLATLPPFSLVPDLSVELEKASELVSGLAPSAPPQSAAALSAVSVWLAWPLRALTFWLAYGLLVLLVSKALGAGTTLPRFYAATGYAAVPLLLLVLYPVPLLGPWLAAAGFALAVVSYVLAVAFATELDRWRAAICVLLPAAVLALVSLIVGAIAFIILL